MNKRFSHLVWLGAGTASEPADLFNGAEQVTLIEAREAACLLLQKKYLQPNFNIKQRLIGVVSGSVEFTEYNLVGYSAIAPVTGLKSLFPGLKKNNVEQLTSTAIGDVIDELSLSGDKNTLIIDIPDSNLALLQALQENGQISLFKKIHIHTALEPLYHGSSTSQDIINYLENSGYELLKTDSNDPELPWLSFSVNQAQKKLDKITQELEKIKDELTAEQHAKEVLGKELENAKQELVAQQQAKDSINKELEKFQKIEQEQARQLDKFKNDLEQVGRHATSRAEKIAQLEKTNSRYLQINNELQKRQQVLQQELLKTEAQIDVIKELLLKK